MEKPIVFTNLPLCEDLCHILVSMDPFEKKDNSVKSDFQWQLLKTRLLLFSERNILATPAVGLLRHIHVISKREYFNSGSLNATFHKLKLKVESVGTLTFSMYEQCLIYNLLVKLSPYWNKVEKYFVEGRYFLMQRGALHAIELNVILKGDMLMLYASPLRLWLREVPLFDLLPSSQLKDSLSKPFYIDLHSERQWVHVLPSFKRGHLVYVTNRIPKDSTFGDYQQLRRHWKNTYGYRLPETDSSPIYVGISFFGSQDFLYPLECVRRGMHMNVDEPDVVANFARAVAAKSAFICGNRIKLRNLPELQNMPRIQISERLKWSESGLAELNSELLNRWLFQSDDSLNMTSESQNISLSTQTEQSEDDPNKKQEYDSWLGKCSQFIDKLNQGGLKRSFLKASQPIFTAPSPPKKRPSKPRFEPQPSSCAITKVGEDSSVPGKESQASLPLLKPCFNKIEILKPRIILERVNLNDEVKSEVNKSSSNYEGTIYENNLGSQNKTSIVDVGLSSGVLFKPVFKKRKSKVPIEDEKKVSRSVLKSKSTTSKKYMAVKKTSSDVEIRNRRKKKKIQKDFELLKEKNLITGPGTNVEEVGTKMHVQETATNVNDVHHEDEQRVIHSETSIIEVENAVENQVENKPEDNVMLNSNEYISPDLVTETVVEEEVIPIINVVTDMQGLPVVYENRNSDITKQIVTSLNKPANSLKEDQTKFMNFVSDKKELPLMYENKHIDAINKQNVIRKSSTPSSAPKEPKKKIILTTTEIENLALNNQLEKANVPSLCSYLKGRGIPFSKDRKKNVLLEKVKEIIMSERRE